MNKIEGLDHNVTVTLDISLYRFIELLSTAETDHAGHWCQLRTSDRKSIPSHSFRGALGECIRSYYVVLHSPTYLFQMNGNQIPDLQALERELSSIKSLSTLYLEGNPCQQNDMTGYRRKIMLALPQLKQIDAT